MSTTAVLDRKNFAKPLILDILAVAFIYFVPTFSHLLSFPLYLVEPMRIMLILALAHTNRKNAYLLALTLPLFSWAVSMHPVFIKTGLIATELVINVFLFSLIERRYGNLFLAAIGSIIISKLVYYGLKYIMISSFLLDSSLISTPIWMQIIITFALSAYIYFFSKIRED